MSFYQRKEIKDLLAYLRLTVNPKDNEAFKRIVNYPKRGIGDGTVDKLLEFSKEHNLSLFESLATFSAAGKIGQQLQMFRMQIIEMQDMSRKSNAYDAAIYSYKISGLSSELKQDVTNEGISRLENVMALLDGIKDFTENDEVLGDTTRIGVCLLICNPLRSSHNLTKKRKEVIMSL